MKLDHLPEDCISQVLSFLSPQEVCRSALVSTSFHSAADSNAIWERFLPPDYREILSRMVSPVEAPPPSKKDLFLTLCNPRLIDGGTKAFSIEKSTGKICYALSARELSIAWAWNPLYWTWKPLHNSRFAEAAELRTIWWLEIEAKMNTRMLSPNTVYSAYLIVQFETRSYGLDTVPSEASIQVGSYKSQATVHLRHPDGSGDQSLCEADWIEAQKSQRHAGDAKGEEERGPCERGDGWVEIELGEFYNGEGDGNEEVKMGFKEVKGLHLKGGLIVEGIELRPKKIGGAVSAA